MFVDTGIPLASHPSVRGFVESLDNKFRLPGINYFFSKKNFSFAYYI